MHGGAGCGTLSGESGSFTKIALLTAPYWIETDGPVDQFPDVALALREPDGLLAAGGDLSPARIIAAYRQGIFPWYSEGQPILWWSPDPRSVLFPEHLKISRSLRKTLNKNRFRVTFDSAFPQIIEGCAAPRRGESGTWITAGIKQAYQQLHEAGVAHSVECWENGELAGGLYGVAIGQVFFGESMFSRRSDASKVAFVHLVEMLREWNFGLIDCQVATRHLASLGAVSIPRIQFVKILRKLCSRPGQKGNWQYRANNNI